MTALQQLAQDMGITIPEKYFELEKQQIIDAYKASDDNFFEPMAGEDYYIHNYPNNVSK